MKYQAVAVALLMFLGACQVGTGNGFDRRKIEDRIEEVAREEALPDIQVRCPMLLWLRAGKRFDCDVALAPGESPHVASVSLGAGGRVLVDWDVAGAPIVAPAQSVTTAP